MTVFKHPSDLLTVDLLEKAKWKVPGNPGGNKFKKGEAWTVLYIESVHLIKTKKGDEIWKYHTLHYE